MYVIHACKFSRSRDHVGHCEGHLFRLSTSIMLWCQL